MPVYEYKCIKCEEIKETLLLNNEKPPKYCKKCGGKLKKLISNSTFKLKGGGWFADGYSKKRGKPPKKN